MSECSGRNQRIQWRKAELTLAQIRERLPNGWADWHRIWHTCANSYGNVYTPNKLTLETQGGTRGGGVRVSQIQKSRKAVKRLDRLVLNLAHICRSIWEWIYTKHIAPRDTRGHLGGGGEFRGQAFKSLGKLSNGWTDWHQLWSVCSSGNGHRLNPSRPSIHQGAFRGGGVGGHKFKSLGKLSNGSPIGTTFGIRQRIRLGMDIG